MAVIRINLNDQITAWLNKTNNLSAGVGDIDDLPAQDSTIVEALNRIRTETDTLLVDIRDSAEIVDIARNSVYANDAGGLGSFSYAPNTGTFTYTGPDQGDIRSLFSPASDDDSSATIEFDTANGTIAVKKNRLTNLYLADGAVIGRNIADNTISSSKATSTSTLNIYNSSGTIVKTIVGWSS